MEGSIKGEVGGERRRKGIEVRRKEMGIEKIDKEKERKKNKEIGKGGNIGYI